MNNNNTSLYFKSSQEDFIAISMPMTVQRQPIHSFRVEYLIHDWLVHFYYFTILPFY